MRSYDVSMSQTHKGRLKELRSSSASVIEESDKRKRSPERLLVPFKKGSKACSEAKQMILNVYVKLREIHPEQSIRWVVSRTAFLTKVSEKSVFKFKQEALRTGKLSNPKQRIPDSDKILRRLDRHSPEVLAQIRSMMESLASNREVVTAMKLLDTLNSTGNAKFGLRTMQRLLKDLGYQTKRHSLTRRERDPLVDNNVRGRSPTPMDAVSQENASAENNDSRAIACPPLEVVTTHLPPAPTVVPPPTSIAAPTPFHHHTVLPPPVPFSVSCVSSSTTTTAALNAPPPTLSCVSLQHRNSIPCTSSSAFTFAPIQHMASSHTTALIVTTHPATFHPVQGYLPRGFS